MVPSFYRKAFKAHMYDTWFPHSAGRLSKLTHMYDTWFPHSIGRLSKPICMVRGPSFYRKAFKAHPYDMCMVSLYMYMWFSYSVGRLLKLTRIDTWFPHSAGRLSKLAHMFHLNHQGLSVDLHHERAVIGSQVWT